MARQGASTMIKMQVTGQAVRKLRSMVSPIHLAVSRTQDTAVDTRQQ